MNVTAECINNGAVDYGYFPVRTLRLQNAAELPCILYQGVPHYIGSRATMYIDIDFTDLINYDAIVVMDDSFIRPDGTLIFNSMLVHPIRFIAECLDIPLIFCTKKGNYTSLKQNETELFKTVTSINALKLAIKNLNLNSDSKVYVINAWCSMDMVYPEVNLHTKYGLKFLKEY